eukprot:1184356-Prorocentrum_minimum.AAC.2
MFVESDQGARSPRKQTAKSRLGACSSDDKSHAKTIIRRTSVRRSSRNAGPCETIGCPKHGQLCTSARTSGTAVELRRVFKGAGWGGAAIKKGG